MGALTEVEIFDCMTDNLRKAVQHARDLAVKPAKGPSYVALRNELKLIEGACRQASAWRQDAQWLPIGLQMEQVHQHAKEWLRGVQDPVTGRRRPLPEGVRHPMFLKLAEVLEMLFRKVDDLRARKTGRTGAILPVPRPGPHRQTRDAYGVILPEGMQRRDSGLIIPSGVAA